MNDPRNSREWKQVRLRVIDRDGCCAVCGSEDKLTVDHVVPISKGGAPFDEDNLVTLCDYHNKQKGNRMEGQTTDYINRKWIEFEKK